MAQTWLICMEAQVQSQRYWPETRPRLSCSWDPSLWSHTVIPMATASLLLQREFGKWEPGF